MNDLQVKNELLKVFTIDGDSLVFAKLLDEYVKDVINQKVQLDVLMKLDQTIRFSDYSNPV